MIALALAACAVEPRDSVGETAAESAAPTLTPFEVRVTVTLDGAPIAGASVMQAGTVDEARTDADGTVTILFDPTILGEPMVVAGHPEARIAGAEVDGPGAVTVALTRFVATDNPAYTFADPGDGDLDHTTTAACGHCHRTIHEAWAASPHRTAASNPVTLDVYAGTARGLDEPACLDAGNAWVDTRSPDGGPSAPACVVGDGVAERTGGFGACADCHAPGIDGVLGGRDLLDATGVAYRSGVHCDVCHHVEGVDLAAPAGVAGRLRIVRPSEPGTPAAGPYAPLTFGPYLDVLNPRMGSVYRADVFHSATLCAGCHELRQAVLAPESTIDLGRWPDGTLPVHTTYDEWLQSPAAPAQGCRDCHMPPRPDVGNAADLYNHFDLEPGIAAGYARGPGAVRGHHWYGPRQPEGGMLRVAATVDVEATIEGERLIAEVTTTNVGPGHALPTGEPLRAVLLRVNATCDGAPLAAVGGDVIADIGGESAGVAVGGVLRAIARPGTWRDDPGWGPFGDGTFSPAEKGMPVEALLGEATVIGIAEDGSPILDRALPEADLVRQGDGATMLAGAPGMAFARVLAGADGARMVPHHLAVDVVSDNRLLPYTPVLTRHEFALDGCVAATVSAALIHRDLPPALAAARGWATNDQAMVGESVEVSR